MLPQLLFAQTTQPTVGSTSVPPSTVPITSLERSSLSPALDALIYDGAVDPKEYRMGPGDILSYRSWTSNEGMTILISADEKLVLPRIGEFSIKGKTFDSVKTEVKEFASKFFKRTPANDIRGEFSLVLAQPRKVAVSVLGEVETPGIYTFTAGTRASIAVKIADKLVQRQAIIADEARQKELEKKKRESDRLRPYLGDESKENKSLRYISVNHTDGTTDRIDIVRFNATHDPRFCPLLREGDVIYVPFRKPLEGSIGVYGAVFAPSDFEYVDGDSLWTMIQAAHGPTMGADLTHVELSRMSADGNTSDSRVIDIFAIKNKQASDIRLEAGDRIFIRDKPDQREMSRVVIKGEVMRPGVYPIHRTNTKLSDVIKNAGGFTPYAFLAGGTVIRKKLDIDNKDITSEEEGKLVGRLANLTVIDTANFRFQTELREGYVSTNMARLYEKGDAIADITLRDGDVISVPPSPTTVYVWGYVGSVGYIPYKSGANEKFYINSAGGYAEGAVKSKTRIIKARTRQWLDPDDTAIEPGDEIFVPQEGSYPEDYTLRTTSLIVGIISAVASTVFTIILITKK